MSSATPVQIKQDVYNKLRDSCEKRGVDVKGFVNALIEKTLERYDTIASFFPNLKIVEVTNQSIKIADFSKDAIFTIVSKEDKFYCEKDKTFGCEHLFFLHRALSLEYLQ